MERMRFTGVSNIVRFNWHFYVIAFVFITTLIIAAIFAPVAWRMFLIVFAALIFISLFISLAVSAYIYDFSNLYTFNWLDEKLFNGKQIVNIHAGFDETSTILTKLYPTSTLTVFDFYNPENHTEISIQRARSLYPPFPGTVIIPTDNVPLQSNSVDMIFLTLAIHEIRDAEERTNFLKVLSKTLKPGGRIVVTEHQRDASNFFAFNIGFLHFFSRASWLKNFREAGLQVEKELKVTPFISAFTLQPHGNPS